MTARSCGGCTLCCKLLPMQGGDDRVELADKMIEVGMLTKRDAVSMVKDFDKPAGARCPHQRHGKGCTIYSVRPLMCRFWNCRWLSNDDTAELSRPDRSHYVIDVTPDYVTVRNDENSEKQTVPIIQIWCDPNFPDAHRDPALRAFLERRAAEGYAALVRYNEIDALFITAPAMNANRQWNEHRPNRINTEAHSVEDKVRALGPMTVKLAVKA